LYWVQGLFVPRGTAGEKEKGAGSCVFLHSWNDELCKNTHIDGFKPLICCYMAVLGRKRGVCFFAMRKVRIRIMDLKRFL
jgi:Fe-S-cluster containining protein